MEENEEGNNGLHIAETCSYSCKPHRGAASCKLNISSNPAARGVSFLLNIRPTSHRHRQQPSLTFPKRDFHALQFRSSELSKMDVTSHSKWARSRYYTPPPTSPDILPISKFSPNRIQLLTLTSHTLRHSSRQEWQLILFVARITSGCCQAPNTNKFHE